MDELYTIHDYKTIEERTMHTIPFINQMIAEGHAGDMILVCEAIQEKELGHIAERIADLEKAKIVLIAGPSSSGKTSTSKRLCIQLMACKKRPVALSLDNWFINRADTPLDENGNPDFESVYSMDLKQFNEDLQNLLAGKEVALPTYNFTKGEREYNGEKLTRTPNMILVIEGIHALNPLLTKQIPEENKFKVYASPLSPISMDGETWIPTTANRLLRRISRDYQTRGKSAEFTIAGWQSVRDGEEKWIVPFKDEADALFDTSMLYELAALRPKAETVLSGVPKEVPEYDTAQQLLAFLRCFHPIDADQIPRTSLLREFIGGSQFDVK